MQKNIKMEYLSKVRCSPDVTTKIKNKFDFHESKPIGLSINIGQKIRENEI